MCEVADVRGCSLQAAGSQVLTGLEGTLCCECLWSVPLSVVDESLRHPRKMRPC